MFVNTYIDVSVYYIYLCLFLFSNKLSNAMILDLINKSKKIVNFYSLEDNVNIRHANEFIPNFEDCVGRLK